MLLGSPFLYFLCFSVKFSLKIADFIAKYMKNISQSVFIHPVLMQFILDLVVFFMTPWIHGNFSSAHSLHCSLGSMLMGITDRLQPEYLDGKRSQGGIIITNVITFGCKCTSYGSRESQAEPVFESAIVYFPLGHKINVLFLYFRIATLKCHDICV